MPFLPITAEEMRSLGWQQPDFIIVTGDAYVDHPSFGTAIISRVLEHAQRQQIDRHGQDQNALSPLPFHAAEDTPHGIVEAGQKQEQKHIERLTPGIEENAEDHQNHVLRRQLRHGEIGDQTCR